MRNYILKLIAGLENVANNQPQAQHPGVTSQMADDPANAKSIEEWTGIEQIVFPDAACISLLVFGM